MPTTEVTQTAADVLGPAAIVAPPAPQPPARLIVDPPLPGPLSEDRVYIQYRAVNLRILPVFGPKALEVSPRIGHINVAVDEAPKQEPSGRPRHQHIAVERTRIFLNL